MSEPSSLIVVIRGAGGMASGIAVRLRRAGIARICLLENPLPTSIHRLTAFAEAVIEGYAVVEGVTAALAGLPGELPALWNAGCLGVLVDPGGRRLRDIRPDVLVDTTREPANCFSLAVAPVIIGLRPMHIPGVHAHMVIETSGPALGRVLRDPSELPRGGMPDQVPGLGAFLVHAPRAGVFRTAREIGERVAAGEIIGNLAAPGAIGSPNIVDAGDEGTGNADGVRIVRAPVSGTLRGLLRDYTAVERKARLAYVDPRDGVVCHQITDRALAVGGGVLEALCSSLGARPQPASGILYV
jgi:xanthine dehydrogenase accessory factor